MKRFKNVVPKYLRWEYRDLFQQRAEAVTSSLFADVLYFRMPKVASQSITQSLEQLSSINSIAIPHSLPPSIVRRILKFRKGSFRFSFVRHPYTRFVSAYKWAVRENIDPYKYVLDIPQYSLVSKFPCINSFAVALPILYKEHQKRLIHFTPQANWIVDDDKLLVDFWGKLENLDYSLQRLSEKGLCLPLSFGNNAKNAKPEVLYENASDIVAKYCLSREAENALATFYSRDLTLFEYS